MAALECEDFDTPPPLTPLGPLVQPERGPGLNSTRKENIIIARPEIISELPQLTREKISEKKSALHHGQMRRQKKMLDLVETRNLVAKYLFASITPFVGLFRALESRETFAKL